jgi:hypothetical protein
VNGNHARARAIKEGAAAVRRALAANPREKVCMGDVTAAVTPAHPSKPIPDAAAERKLVPMATGLIDYFPDALAAVAHVSYIGNMQHNPGQPLHWARGKSTDEADTAIRHITQRGTVDTDGVRHTAKAAWRILALLQKELEQEYDLPLPRGCRAAEPTHGHS